MSCEENRLRYFERVAASGTALAGALGGESEARAALEQIFNTARSDGAGVKSPLQQYKAAGRTLQLFEEMEQRHGLSRPTHSTKGMRLPRRDAQFGYQAVYDTIEAARTGRALPDVAVRVLQQRRMRRTISSLRVDDHGYYRCSNCGQFASRTREHICPFTATSADLARALHRRLGVPGGAYICMDSAGRRLDGLQELLDAVRAPTGKIGGVSCTLRMLHCLTGEEADVTLDGAIPALGQGFVPHMWAGRPGLRHVELSDRRVVAVLDASGMYALDPAAVLGIPATPEPQRVPATGSIAEPYHRGASRLQDAVQTAAAAYGTVLAPGSLVHSLGATGPLKVVAAQTNKVVPAVSAPVAAGSPPSLLSSLRSPAPVLAPNQASLYFSGQQRCTEAWATIGATSQARSTGRAARVAPR